MDFLNHRESGMVFYQVFLLLLYSVLTVEIVTGCVSFKKKKSQSKTAEATVNSKEENS